MLSPYEIDIASQPDALRVLSRSQLPDAIDEVRGRGSSRVIVTGMGSSHCSGFSTWRTLVRNGVPAWWIDTSQLLDSIELIAEDALVIATSQSGRSGEIVALLEQLPSERCTLVGVVNDMASPLALQSAIVIDMCAGQEATVSTKSYLNSVAIHAELASVLTSGLRAAIRPTLPSIADELEGWLVGPSALTIDDLGFGDGGRLVLIGSGLHTPTSLMGALVIKEASKTPVEAYLGGDFRHGPIELAGPGLSAVILADDASSGNDLSRLARDLTDSGSRVVELRTPPNAADGHDDWNLRQLFFGAISLQRLSVELARQRGIEPGAFLFGRKITDTV